jgi:hypothetical protein
MRKKNNCCHKKKFGSERRNDFYWMRGDDGSRWKSENLEPMLHMISEMSFAEKNRRFRLRLQPFVLKKLS